MESGRLYNKQQTTTAGTNLTNSSSQAYKRVELEAVPSATSNNLQYQGEDDSQKVISNVGGVSTAGENEINPIKWGYNAPSGSRIELNDTGGSERIDVIHTSGAGLTIEPDGAIYINSKSSRGAGMAAPLGDVVITAGGDIVIKGAAGLTIHTAGDLNLDVGGSFIMSCENYSLNTKNYAAIIDGAATTTISTDNSIIVGGIDRKTVAGDQREQTTGKRIIDVGADYTNRVGGNQSLDVQGTSTHSIKGDHKLQTAAKTTITSDSDTTVNTGGALAVKTTGQTNINGSDEIHVKSAANMIISSQADAAFIADGDALVVAKGDMQVSGESEATFSSQGETQVLSQGTAKIIGSETEIHGSTISNRCGTFLSKEITGDPGGPNSASVPSAPSAPGPDGPDGSEEAKDAEVMEANDIVDTLSSARKYPEYPGNGVRESANATGLGTISGDETPQAQEVFDEYSGGNAGNANPSQQMDVYDTLPEAPVDRDPEIVANDPGRGIPSYNNMSAQISKYFTVGQLINGTTTRQRPSPDQWDSIIKQGILLANNVLDPIKEKFPDLIVTSWYRYRTPNHGTGRAIDIVVESRSMTKHAEIARFARDHLPVDQVFLEKNTTGRTHVHVRVANAGSKTTPRVMTCGDPKCTNKVPGIQVGWLGRRAK